MRRAISSSRPCFAAVLLPHRPPEARLARPEQSAAAQDLLRRLRAQSGVSAGPSSKAHSRAMIAAAAAPEGRVGVDVEYLAPGRAIREIARFLLDEDLRDDATAYRAFTFREAYFKAFGEFPERALSCAVANRREAFFRPHPDFGVLRAEPARGFLLTLVWTMDGAPECFSL